MRPKYDLRTILDRGSVLLQESGERVPVRLSAGLDCQRKLGLKATRAPQRPLDPEGARIFRMGQDRGSSHVEALLACKDKDDKAKLSDLPQVWEVEHEVWLPIPIDDEHAERAQQILTARFGSQDNPFAYEPTVVTPRVRGRIDVVLKHMGRFTIVDFKTCAEYAFEKIDVDDWHTASESYLGQLGAYCKAFIETERLDALTDPVLVYERKDTSALKIQYIPLEIALQYGQAAAKNLADVLTAIADGKELELPRSYGPDGKGKLPWNCSYCNVVDACWKDNNLREVHKPTKRMPDYYVDSQ